ncbi:hypothetical protein J7E86_28725 [Streptomyces sp. ISL-11]|nr:hypothetical protein [Streptomyces sp. ISL-11]
MVAAAASAMVLGQASVALADDHGHGLGPLPVAIVSPAPGKITKEHKVTDTYQYDQKASGSSSSEQPPSSQTPPPPAAEQPGPVTEVKDAANSAPPGRHPRCRRRC